MHNFDDWSFSVDSDDRHRVMKGKSAASGRNGSNVLTVRDVAANGHVANGVLKAGAVSSRKNCDLKPFKVPYILKHLFLKNLSNFYDFTVLDSYD